eukprot:CAMPEP_0118836414 /NCGR_PEP_ID=MMETSP1162-20130426/58514_1 /TAXON_ID=33656 /ORGANISM="Phaeocystis Sp, Strain CCMP2710" /LENGTH=38 /DNA_ID= /DNA_START= /DNA_END= /DNA_ORIENTATION=
MHPPRVRARPPRFRRSADGPPCTVRHTGCTARHTGCTA